MTIKELYEWARRKGAEEVEIYVHDEGDFFIRTQAVEESVVYDAEQKKVLVE